MDVPAITADDLRGVRAVHTGSIALFLEPGGAAVLEALRAARTRGGDRQRRPEHPPRSSAIMPTLTPRGVRRGPRSADLVKLSDEERAISCR